MAIVIGDGGEEVPPFWCGKACSPSSMLRVLVPAYQESGSQGSEERDVIVSRYDVARGAVDGRYRQWPWASNKSNGCSLHSYGLVML
jgi:hypothetical protein